jgi:uncharacterized protein YdaL
VTESAQHRPAGTGSRAVRFVPLAVLAVVTLAVAVPSVLLRHHSEPLAPLRLPAIAQPPKPFPAAATWPAEAARHRRTLVLYDRTGKWGWLGELYATMTGNLVSHFGRWSAQPVAAYRPGELGRYNAVIYIGSTYGESLPDAFLDDVLRTDHPVLWLSSNIWQLERRTGDFVGRYGFETYRFDRSPVSRVKYKETTLTRRTERTAGIMTYAKLETSRVRILAQAVRANGSTFPWAVRARNLTYVGEIPFTYVSETDRVLAFDDLLFDLLAPQTRERHRALVRLEDINPLSDPAELKAAADYLHSREIPFGFGVSPRYRDLTGNGDTGEPADVLLRDAPKLASTIKYLERRGGVLVGHGYTHQWDGGDNPYDGVTGDDVEFFRASETPRGRVRYDGPLPDDSRAWADRRMALMEREFEAAGIPRPSIFEFPHYAASANDYRAATRRYPVRWERAFYFGGLLTGRVDPKHLASQFFPYVVHDVYGSKVLPENLGSIQPRPWHSYPSRLSSDIIAAAKANLVVRDGFAAFFFHPFLNLRYLERTVAGIRRLGYTFVNPASL